MASSVRRQPGLKSGLRGAGYFFEVAAASGELVLFWPDEAVCFVGDSPEQLVSGNAVIPAPASPSCLRKYRRLRKTDSGVTDRSEMNHSGRRMMFAMRIRCVRAGAISAKFLPQREQRRTASSLQAHVAADDSFEVPVVGAQKQCAIGVERFRVAFERAPADCNGHGSSDGGAQFFPFVRDGLELAGRDPCVVEIQLSQNRYGQFWPVHVVTRFDSERGRHLADFWWKLARVDVDIDAQA